MAMCEKNVLLLVVLVWRWSAYPNTAPPSESKDEIKATLMKLRPVVATAACDAQQKHSRQSSARPSVMSYSSLKPPGHLSNSRRVHDIQL